MKKERKKNTVQVTGAQAGSILIGINPKSNKGLVVKIVEDQEEGRSKGGSINGKFKLLDAGEGDYHQALETLVGKVFDATQLHEEVAKISNINKIMIMYSNSLRVCRSDVD